jgi:hypothetical protein
MPSECRRSTTDTFFSGLLEKETQKQSVLCTRTGVTLRGVRPEDHSASLVSSTPSLLDLQHSKSKAS